MDELINIDIAFKPSSQDRVVTADELALLESLLPELLRALIVETAESE